jgi:hypothetical protein
MKRLHVHVAVEGLAAGIRFDSKLHGCRRRRAGGQPVRALCRASVACRRRTLD